MRVLILIPGPLGQRVSAPEVRGWNIAVELGRHHDVMIAAPGAEASVRDGIPLIPLERRRVLKAAREADAVIAVPVPLYIYALLARHATTLVAEMYNPVEAELAENPGLSARLRRASIRANESFQLEFADIVLCAVEAQRRRLESRIADLAGARERRPLLRVVPFGIDNDPPPPPTRRPIRERFETIGDDDLVILWWGNVWRWFDSETALRAFGEVVRDHPNAKLVFTGGRPPRGEASELDETDRARELARALGLLGGSVHFVDEWIPHAQRHEYLQEADIGLTLHRETPEREVAARGRYMDYLWTRLPCVLGRGDELADRFAGAGFAATVTPGDIEGAANELRRLIRDPAARASAADAANGLIDAFRWSRAVEPLLDALEQAQRKGTVRRSSPARLSARLAGIYVRRIAWEAAKALEARRPQLVSAHAPSSGE